MRLDIEKARETTMENLSADQLGKLISLRRDVSKNETLLYQMGVHFKR